MTHVFSPRLDILPAAQRRLWPELSQTPSHFTLHSGTAIALRLVHRQSVDFDFFSLEFVRAGRPSRRATVLEGCRNSAVVAQYPERDDRSATDLCSCLFFGGRGLGQVAAAEIAEGPRFKVASLIDLAGMKAAVVTQRAELKDYLDIDALLTEAGISLATMLAAAAVIYGPQFNALLALKAVAYHDDPTLAALPQRIRHDLIDAVTATDPQHLPTLIAFRPWQAKS